MISRARLTTLLAEFPRRRIGLIGDLFLDRYVDIDAALDEPSLETGLTAYQVSNIRNQPGALGTVMNNLAALGVGQMVPVTVLGDDGQAYDLRRAVEKLPVSAEHVLADPARFTPTYTKPMRHAAGAAAVELNRLDIRTRAPLGEATLAEVCRRVTAVFDSCDGLIVLDQINEEGWGVVGPPVRNHLAMLARQHPEKLMFVDSRAQIHRFTQGTLKPNLNECLAALGRPVSDDRAVGQAAARELSDRLGLTLYCTMGAWGVYVTQPGQLAIECPAFPVSGPIDIVGAGDSCTAGIVLSLLSGATPTEAATVGNLVASITIQQLGTTGTATPAQVLARWDAAC